MELIGILNGHDPVPSEMMEGLNLILMHSRGESDYFAELWKLAKYCNYGDSSDMRLHDRIVCGIQVKVIQRILLSK